MLEHVGNIVYMNHTVGNKMNAVTGYRNYSNALILLKNLKKKIALIKIFATYISVLRRIKTKN